MIISSSVNISRASICLKILVLVSQNFPARSIFFCPPKLGFDSFQNPHMKLYRDLLICFTIRSICSFGIFSIISTFSINCAIKLSPLRAVSFFSRDAPYFITEFLKLEKFLKPILLQKRLILEGATLHTSACCF